jgi:hypothetical protein
MSAPPSNGAADLCGDPPEDTRSQSASVQRMSWEGTRKFATVFQILTKECRLPSVYALFLHTDSGYARSTLKRWLRGEGRIPVDGARRLIEALLDYAAQLSTSALIQELDNLVRAESHEQSDETRLRAELRARRVPVSRTLAALRAVSLLPPEANTP